MEGEREHFRHILLYYYRRGKSVQQARKKLADLYGKDALTELQCRNLFSTFQSSKEDDKGQLPKKQHELLDIRIKGLIDQDPRITSREIVERLNISSSMLYDHLKCLGLIIKLDTWVPHVLSEKNLCRRINTCDVLLRRNEVTPIVERIITGDQKWVFYHCLKRKRPCGADNRMINETERKKVMMSLWWDFKGVVLFEILPENTKLEAVEYRNHLDRLNQSLKQKRPKLIRRKEVLFHDSNPIPHTNLLTRQKIMQLGWELMPHPPFSPDLSPSDYYMFRTIQTSLEGTTFTSNEDLKRHLEKCFTNKEQDFYERGLRYLPERWQRVLERNGDYLSQ